MSPTAVAVWKSLWTGGSPEQLCVVNIKRSSKGSVAASYHQFPCVGIEVQSVHILAEPLVVLLVPPEDVHVVAHYGGAVSVPLTRNVALNQGPLPPVGFSTECEEEIAGGLVVSTPEEIAGVSFRDHSVTIPLIRPV